MTREPDKKLDWQEFARFFLENKEVKTRLGKKFFVKQVTDYGVFCLIPEEIIFISRKDLEKAYQLIQEGVRISSPRDYMLLVSKEHPNYAYSIIRAFLFPFTDRRRWPRVNREVKVELLLDDKRLETKTVDISAGGVRLKLKERLRENNTYPLIVFLEDEEEPINVFARVVWSSPADKEKEYFFFGLEFVHIDDYDRLRIASAVNRWLLEEEDIYRT